MDQITTEINKLDLKIDAIEQLLEKSYEEWTFKEKQKFGNHEQLRKKEEQLRKKEEQLRKKEEQLRKKEEQLRKKEEQLRELLILKETKKQQLEAIATKLSLAVALPKLGDVSSMYDVFGRLSSKPTSTPSLYTGPSYHITKNLCKFIEEDIAPPLSQQEREAILNETNKLWEFGNNEIIQPSVSIGSTENVVDD